MDRLEIGQEIKTAIVAITKDCIFLDLNTKSEGVLDRAELADENGKLSVKEGDVIKVYYLGYQDGEMKFTTKISGDKADKTLLENAYKNGIPVEGHVEKEIKGGFEIKIGDSRAFCPYSQMGYKQKEEPAFYVGKHLVFRIQEFKENGRNILVSNRAIGEDEYEKKLETIKQTLKEGMTVKGIVESIQSYGAFVDVQGFKALLPVSEVSRVRVEDLSKVLSPGQEIMVQVLKTDWQNDRVSLSMKSLESDPWDGVAQKYIVDSKYKGKISRIAEFGLFIELEPGVDGLVHISELEDADRNTNLRKKFKVGTDMTVVVKAVNIDERRLSLKPATTNEQDSSAAEYLNAQSDEGTDTYNPFAALLKKTNK